MIQGDADMCKMCDDDIRYNDQPDPESRRQVLEARLRNENLTADEMAELDALQRQPDPAAIHVGQGDDLT